MSTTLHVMEALQSGMIEAAGLIGYPAAVMMTAGTVGTGLASVVAIMSYPGGHAGLVDAPRERTGGGFWSALKAAFERNLERHRAMTEIEELDARMLRDIGLTRGDILSLRTMRDDRARNSDRFMFRGNI